MSGKVLASDAVKARLMLVGLCLAWGLTWPAMRIALAETPPFTMRALSFLTGALTLIMLARMAGRPVTIPPRHTWADIFVASVLNIVLFSLGVTFAQLVSFTGRVAIIVYTFPIWVTVLAWLFLGERLSSMRAVALLLCAVGMMVLIYPLATHGIPFGQVLAFGAALSWALGTIYLKVRRIDVDAFTLATWQVIVALAVTLTFALFFEGPFGWQRIGYVSLACILFAGIFGAGVAYFLWFRIVQMLPASTASLGSLAAPVIGIVSSAILLNEPPTAPDMIGYALIFIASVCVLLQPNMQAKRSANNA